MVTAKTLEGFKEYFKETLRLHFEGCVADGDALPGYLIDGNYDVEYELDTTALLRDAENYTTLAAVYSSWLH